MHVQMRWCTTGRDLMRLRHRSGRLVHLSSGIDVHGTRDLPAVVERIDAYATEVRSRLDAGVLAVSLWLPPTLAAALAVDGRLRTRLRGELDARGLEVVTLSGMPYAGGGGENPIEEPDWSDPDRLEYTLDLARVLVDLLPDETVRGAIGTIGLAPKEDWDEETAKTGAGILRRLSGGLADIAWQTGRAVRVGFHTASGYAVDSPEETVAALARIDKDRLGVRLDLEHVTRTWEDPVAGLETLSDAGLSIVEVRLTAAPGPRLDAWRAALGVLLGPDGPQTEYLTLARHVDDPSAEQIASDLAYLRAELAALGLAPENEPCPAR
jgi:sugar phosphate isomerase/epimerase